MAFVQRDEQGAITGVYRVAQPGYAEEEVADDAAKVVAFLAPKPERRKVLKSTVVARLIAAGKIDAAFAALQANKGAFARWFSPDHPAVYADDPDALALLQAIGADPAVILA